MHTHTPSIKSANLNLGLGNGNHAMQQRTLIISIDLGTSSTTASHIIVTDSFTPEGQLHRERGLVSVKIVRDWPGANNGDATGNVCVPTDLIYSRTDRQLLFWGFRAKQYLDDPYPDIEPDTVFVVEHIKLLQLNPDDATTRTTASQRYREQRNTLIATLGKQPEEVFADFLDAVVTHVMGSVHRKYASGMSALKVELVLAFPSGWPDFLHTRISAIGAGAVSKAIAALNLQGMVFGIENVYTVSETLCGVKEWLRDTIADASTSIDPDLLGINLDELNEGDCFLPVDIGGGTGCMTPLRLVTKNPLRVDQLGPTVSLEVSGEAVEAEFEAWLRPRITTDDYADDIPQLIHQICRKFKEEKKECGLPPRLGSTTWNVAAPRLQPNRDKGFIKDCMKIERSVLDKCFDPVIDLLEKAIDGVLRLLADIKTIVFLGQFGSSSEYLRKRMANSHFSNLVKLRHSFSGKLDVVMGALSERLILSESFVRKSKTLKSYGTLVTISYNPGLEGAVLFPNAIELGAVPLEHDADGYRVKVIEWAIPMGTSLEDNQTTGIGKNGILYHTWPYFTAREDIWFEDMIVVSDEVPPPPHEPDGKSYTLWTKAHEQNCLVLGGRKMQVQQIPFSWDLSMSQKLDDAGNYLGSYNVDDLETSWYPEVFRKGRRRVKQKRLHYELIWHITEMQVKVHVRAHFPNQPGPRTTQLAEEHIFEAHETSRTGESRSKALKRDIEISEAASVQPRKRARLAPQEPDVDQNNTQEGLTGAVEPARVQSLDDSVREHQQQSSATLSQITSPNGSLPIGQQNTTVTESTSTNISKPLPKLVFVNPKTNTKYHDSCYTCQIRQKKCDCKYIFNHTTGTNCCKACLRYKLECLREDPHWDAPRAREKLLEWKTQIRLWKRENTLLKAANAEDHPTAPIADDDPKVKPGPKLSAKPGPKPKQQSKDKVAPKGKAGPKPKAGPKKPKAGGARTSVASKDGVEPREIVDLTDTTTAVPEENAIPNDNAVPRHGVIRTTSTVPRISFIPNIFVPPPPPPVPSSTIPQANSETRTASSTTTKTAAAATAANPTEVGSLAAAVVTPGHSVAPS